MNAILVKAIDQFEAAYPPRLKRWSLFIQADELERVTALLAEAQQESERLSALIKEDGTPLLQTRWLMILEATLSYCEPINQRLVQLQKESYVARQLLSKGQVGLTGYRQNLGNKRLILDSQA